MKNEDDPQASMPDRSDCCDGKGATLLQPTHTQGHGPAELQDELGALALIATLSRQINQLEQLLADLEQ